MCGPLIADVDAYEEAHPLLLAAIDGIPDRKILQPVAEQKSMHPGDFDWDILRTVEDLVSELGGDTWNLSYRIDAIVRRVLARVLAKHNEMTGEHHTWIGDLTEDEVRAAVEKILADETVPA